MGIPLPRKSSSKKHHTTTPFLLKPTGESGLLNRPGRELWRFVDKRT